MVAGGICCELGVGGVFWMGLWGVVKGRRGEG